MSIGYATKQFWIFSQKYNIITDRTLKDEMPKKANFCGLMC